MWCIKLYVSIKLFLCGRQNIKHIKVPWLWIGGKVNESTIDLTDDIQELLESTDVITNEILTKRYPQCTEWYYVDNKTFKEIKIPVEGIQI